MIGLYRQLDTPQPRDLIEAVNSLNDKLGKNNVQILHSIAKPNQVLIFAGYKSLADCESQGEEYVSAGLREIARDHGVNLVDQGAAEAAGQAEGVKFENCLRNKCGSNTNTTNKDH